MNDCKYFVVGNDIGLSVFDMSNDSMCSMSASKDMSEWIQFNLDDAIEAARVTGWEMFRVDEFTV